MTTTNSPLTADVAYEALARGGIADGATVTGVLDYSSKSGRPLPAGFPDNLHVDVLDLTDRDINELPRGLEAYELILAGTPVRSLPAGLRVEVRLDLSRCERLESLPCDLTVGTLLLRGCTGLTSLPEGLEVWFLDMTGCWAFDGWPQQAYIGSGRLQLRGCAALKGLPWHILRLSALNVCDCPNLTSLPEELVVTGWIDLGRSGLKNESSLPPGLAHTQLRWAGVNIDRRIAFHAETITVQEVLNESNAERRRVLLDRYGYGRFLQDAAAEILDGDSDPGGPRQLLRVKLEKDEDLVALSCLCPSTGRQYIIRVPPATPTCRHAAAWIAGFDNPDDYRPILET